MCWLVMSVRTSGHRHIVCLLGTCCGLCDTGGVDHVVWAMVTDRLHMGYEHGMGWIM